MKELHRSKCSTRVWQDSCGGIDTRAQKLNAWVNLGGAAVTNLDRRGVYSIGMDYGEVFQGLASGTWKSRTVWPKANYKSDVRQGLANEMAPIPTLR